MNRQKTTGKGLCFTAIREILMNLVSIRLTRYHHRDRVTAELCRLLLAHLF
jgi:hypothetical protein